MSNEKIFFYPDPGGVVEYQKVDEREGTHGLVHIVRQDNDNYFVLKEPKEHNKPAVSLFTDYKETFKGRLLPRHFVTIQDYGFLGNSGGKEENRPALLMPYAGRDLSWMFEHFKGFSENKPEDGVKQFNIKHNVREALTYKIMVTVFESL